MKISCPCRCGMVAERDDLLRHLSELHDELLMRQNALIERFVEHRNSRDPGSRLTSADVKKIIDDAARECVS